MQLKEEYEKLTDALAYWGDEKLHKMLDKWFRKLKAQSQGKVK